MGIGVGYNSAVNFSDLLGQIAIGQIPDNLITLAKLALSGTPDGTKFLRDDGSWQTVSGAQATGNIHFVNARFTLTSNTPVLTSSVTAAVTGYITPFNGNFARLYYNSAWNYYALSEIPIDFSLLNASTLYDVFLYWNGSSVVAETVAWTNTTTRATALATQDGVYVKTGDPTRLYFASFYLDASKQCHYHVGPQPTSGGTVKVYFCNLYNQRYHTAQIYMALNYWTYAVNSWRIANAEANFKIEYVKGVDEGDIEAYYGSNPNSNAANTSALIGVGIDSTSAFSGFTAIKNGNNGYIQARYAGPVSKGLRYVAGIEMAGAAATAGYTGYDASVQYKTGLELKIAC